MYNIYKCNENDSARFLLGKNGFPSIIIVALNPSTANKEKSDTTVAKVETVSLNNGFHGFIVTNLYPLRSTDPKALPQNHERKLIKENTKQITAYAEKEKTPVFWAAWGDNISTRPYFTESLTKLIPEVARIGGSWLNFGNLTIKGHPRHPSRLSYSWQFQEFDIEKYIEKLG